MDTVKRPNGYYWIVFREDITGDLKQPAKYVNFTSSKGEDFSYWEMIGSEIHEENHSNIIVLGPCICPYFG